MNETKLENLRKGNEWINADGDKPKKRKILLEYLGFVFDGEENIVGINGKKINNECKIDKNGMISINGKNKIKVHASDPGNKLKKDIYYVIYDDDGNYIFEGKFKEEVQWLGNEKRNISSCEEKDTIEELIDSKKCYSDEQISKLKQVLEVIIMGNGSEETAISIIEKNIKVYSQVIFVGAPGTGKTYGVRKAVEDLCERKTERMKFVQFHPSYDYSDFVEGLRPVQIGTDNAPTFVRLDGIFKEFCRNIVEAGLKKARKIRKDIDIEKIFKLSTGKIDDQNKDAILNAFNNEEELYFFVVDEINRADLSKVFGELMFGLEESYRGIENRFDTQYMNLPTYEVKDGKASKMEKDCFKNGFFIPKNLKFIGTMNDIDRSVESFDFALRRRFQWIDIKANEVMESSLTDMLPKDDKDSIDSIKSLADRIKEMNNELSKFGLSEAYYIGPAYFKNYNYDDPEVSLETIFNEKIEPIIREYTRGRDVNKVRDLVTECRKRLLENSENQTNGGND